MRRSVITLIMGLVLIGTLGGIVRSAMAAEKLSDRPQRMIVLSDMGADPDDTQSMVRLFLYANEIEIRGLVATTSVWKQSDPAPQLIEAVLNAYGAVQPNLLLHDPRYPSLASLQGVVRRGAADYGMKGVGAGKDSPGSDLILQELRRPDDRPLWVTAWGGANTLAQALFTLRATVTTAQLSRLLSRLRVHTISDQDDAGPWIRQNFPDLFYIVAPGGDYGASTWIAINSVIPGIDNSRISNGWLAQHIQQDHGPLGAAYPDVAWGMEGDTPSWLNLIPNGLNDPERPDWGGWGGRYRLTTPKIAIDQKVTFIDGKPIPQETRPIWTNADDSYTPFVKADYGRAMKPGDMVFSDAKVTLWRWRDDFQNDFAARMDWTVKPVAASNHPPRPALSHPDRFTVKSGQGFGLDAGGTTDPDGDSLSYLWFTYPEAGTFKGKIDISAENAIGVWVKAPIVDAPQTIHFILRVSDKGTPSLTRYRRIIVTVTPK